MKSHWMLMTSYNTQYFVFNFKFLEIFKNENYFPISQLYFT